MKIISSKGCPYGDRLRLMLNAGEKEYDISSDTNEYISGTFVEPSGSASADIFEIIDFLGLGTAESVGCTPEVNGTELQINYLFPQDEIKRNRHVKMAQNFDRGIIQYFNEASKVVLSSKICSKICLGLNKSNWTLSHVYGAHVWL